MDDNGEPKVFFRGETERHTVLKPDYRGAIWATDNPEYSGRRGAGGVNEQLYASIKNPYRYSVQLGTTESYDIDNVIHTAQVNGHDGAIIKFEYTPSTNQMDYANWMYRKAPDRLASEIIPNSMSREGETIKEYIDRAKAGPIETHLAVWKSNQYKSVDNVGLFNEQDPDIQYSTRTKRTSDAGIYGDEAEVMGKVMEYDRKAHVADLKEQRKQLMQEYEQKLKDIHRQWAEEVEAITKSKDYDRREDLKQQKKELQEKHDKAVEKLSTDYQNKLNALKAQNDAERAVLNAQMEADRKALKKDAQKKLEETRNRYQQSREKAVDSRKRTELRHRVQRVVNDLNRLLLQEDKKHHVPEGLKGAVAVALDAVNMEPVDHQQKIRSLQDRLAKARTDEQRADISKKLYKAMDKNDRMQEKLQKLHEAYTALSESDDADSAMAFDEVISEKILDTIPLVGDTPLANMNQEQLRAVYDLYTAVLTRVRNANKAFIAGKA